MRVWRTDHGIEMMRRRGKLSPSSITCRYAWNGEVDAAAQCRERRRLDTGQSFSSRRHSLGYPASRVVATDSLWAQHRHSGPTMPSWGATVRRLRSLQCQLPGTSAPARRLGACAAKVTEDPLARPRAFSKTAALKQVVRRWARGYAAMSAQIGKTSLCNAFGGKRELSLSALEHRRAERADACGKLSACPRQRTEWHHRSGAG